MSKVVRALAPATMALVVVSLVLAIAGESWLARGVWRSLPHAVALAGMIGFVLGRLAPWPAVSVMLLLTYLIPVVSVLVHGRFTVEFLLVWSAALTGLIAAHPRRWQWAYPRVWRLPLVFWALAVAIAWPITALREADFESLDLLQRYNIPNTSIGGSPGMVIGWGMDVAIVHLLGLLWFNWLFLNAKELSDRDFDGRIAWPLAGSIIVGSVLALYQGLFDLTFLSTGSWAGLQRASGSLVDANAFGAVAALWSAGMLAFVKPFRGGRTAMLAAAAACWGGLWMSGSRTALTLAGIAFATVGLSAMSRLTRERLRLAMLAVGATVVASLFAALLLAPASAQNPISRLKRTLPADVSGASLNAFVREMWNRNGYGAVATTLIAQHPATGVGIGLFHLTGGASGHLPPDNAQNWWRHQVAELGFVGAAGLLVWSSLFLLYLIRTSGDRERRLPAAAVKGALLGFGVVSLVGMPSQSLPVSFTFWTFAFWYVRLVQHPEPEVATDGLPAAQWALVLSVVCVYAAVLLAEARGDARPAMRAAVGQWRYTYGVYDRGGSGSDNQTRRLTERHGVAVVPNEAPWMILTVRAEHPDLAQSPVRARVEVNGRTVLNQKIRTPDPLVRVINTGTASRVILESRVDRTWRRSDAPASQPDVGLSLSWRFAAEPPAGVPTITALLRR